MRYQCLSIVRTKAVYITDIPLMGDQWRSGSLTTASKRRQCLRAP